MEALKQKIYTLLRWSERYTKTDMVYLTKGGFWVTAGQGVASLASLILAVSFANLLPKEVYGNYKFILSIVAILSIPTLQGMATAVTRSVSRGFEFDFNKAIKTKFAWGTLSVILGLLLSIYYYLNDNTSLSIAFLISAFFIPFMESFWMYDSLLTGKKLFNISIKYYTITQVVVVTVLLSTLFLTKNLMPILLAYFLSWTIMRFIFFKITTRKFPPNKKSDLSTVSYGKHLSLMGIIETVSTHIDKILIFHFLGASQLAIYTFAMAMPEQVKAFTKAITRLVLPKFSQRNSKEIKGSIVSKMAQSSMAMVLIVIVYIFLAPTIYEILFPQYLESIFYSQLIALSLIPITSILPLIALQSQKETKQLYKLTFINPVIKITTMAILSFLYGINGAIISLLISRFSAAGINLYLFKKNKNHN